MLSSEVNFFRTRYQYRFLNKGQKDVKFCKVDCFEKLYEPNSALTLTSRRQIFFHEHCISAAGISRVEVEIAACFCLTLQAQEGVCRSAALVPTQEHHSWEQHVWWLEFKDYLEQQLLHSGQKSLWQLLVTVWEYTGILFFPFSEGCCAGEIKFWKRWWELVSF